MRELVVDSTGPSESRFLGGLKSYFVKTPGENVVDIGRPGLARLPAVTFPSSLFTDAPASRPKAKKHCESARSRLLLDKAMRTARAKLARDIHDEAGQHLVAAQFQLAAMEQRVSDQTLSGLLTDLRGTLDRLGRELSQLARDTQPQVERDVSLRISELTREWQRCVGIPVELSLKFPRALTAEPRVAETIFRIVQEGLTNIAKHAPDTTAVHIALTRNKHALKLIIVDDGPGIPCSPARCRSARGGSGLRGMRRRMEEVGGRLEVSSRIGEGTRLVAVFPPSCIDARAGMTGQ